MYIVGIDIAKFSHQGIIISKENGEVLCKSFKFHNSHDGLNLLLQKIREVSPAISDFEIGCLSRYFAISCSILRSLRKVLFMAVLF